MNAGRVGLDGAPQSGHSHGFAGRPPGAATGGKRHDKIVTCGWPWEEGIVIERVESREPLARDRCCRAARSVKAAQWRA